MLPFLTETAYAMGGGGATPADPKSQMMGLLPLVAMFAIFYFLLIRPQQKRAKEHKQLIDMLKVGDQVVTAGGIHGKVAAVQDTVLTLEIATGVKIKVNRSSIVATRQEQ